MYNIKVSRDIIGIIRKYLTISKYNVKRNYTLIISHVNKISKNSRKRFSSDTLSPSFLNKKNKFCYCLFCDKITNYDIGLNMLGMIYFETLVEIQNIYSIIIIIVVIVLTYVFGNLMF